MSWFRTSPSSVSSSAFVTFFSTSARADAPQARGVAEVLVHRHVVVERRAIRQIADLGAHLVRLFDHVEPADADGSARRQEVAGENAQRRGLAGAVQAEQPDDLAALDLRGNRADDPPVAVVLEKILDFDHLLFEAPGLRQAPPVTTKLRATDPGTPSAIPGARLETS